MLNVGIDFGSTYTMVSVYRPETDQLETVILDLTSPYIPSVVTLKNGKLEFGKAAKTLTGKKSVESFRSFKMLLSERDWNILTARGYSREYTPAVVAQKFLEDVVQQVLRHFGENKIDNLVIGAPEIWFQEVNTITSRSILRDICSGFSAVSKVQVVSEPTAACAFFAHNYQTIKGKPFDGNILLIDYGGGTLDISLAQILVDGSKDGQQIMEVKVLERSGAGENEEKQIGKASIVYMETVMELAIKKADILAEGQELVKDGKFYQAVNTLESELQSRVSIVDSAFEELGIDDLEELDEEFTVVEYKGEDIEITYADLVQVYDQVIRCVLNENLQVMIEFMKERRIDFSQGTKENFKIAMVGGFCNYYLVRKQIMDIFHIGTHDQRLSDILKVRSDCEKAISLGTALISSGIVGMRNTAPYSVGIYIQNQEKQSLFDYAICFKQDIDYNTPYYHKKPIWIGGNSIKELVINNGYKDKTAQILPLRENFSKQLQNLVENEHGTATVGFSLDSSDILSIWIKEFDLENERSQGEKTIELARFDQLFDMGRLRRLIDE